MTQPDSKEGLFKTNLTALAAYMKHVCHASFSTIRKFIRGVLGEKVSRGYLRKVIENERIWTVIGTCAIQGRSAFNFILEAVKACFQDQPAPSLPPNTS